MIRRLKQKWNIDNDWDFWGIMLIFSLAGMSIGSFRGPVFQLFGITANTPLWIRASVYVPLIVPVYQINLLIYGFLFGHLSFFWEKEKRLGRFLLKIFRRG